jgi:signal transduction histidine kinase
VARRFSPRAEPSGRTLSVSSPHDALVSGDRLRLEQALGNLVDNSLRYGGGSVRLEALQVDGVVELHVADEGSGFPPEFLDTAFERFSRPDAARAGGGAGLGLAIVRTIAAAHGGQTHAANREQGGADVWLVLPQG